MKQLVKDFINDESGATMVEYAILVALISVAVITVIGFLSVEIQNAFQRVVDEMKASTGTGGTAE